MVRALLITLSTVLLSCFRSSSAECLVRIFQHGYVSGNMRVSKSGNDFCEFLSIPYAEPPTGELRFRDPVPKKPWCGTLSAKKDAMQCPQPSPDNVPYSEDCLRLNVFAPQRSIDENKPVIAFIHGGSFEYGNASTSQFGPDFLMDGDVVLVTLQYRLGIYGFFCSGDEAAPGNFGLKDQNLALRWIQKHIRAFGGDPKNVTLMGQSAGSVSVNYHALSDKSKGLFAKYIMQSGTVTDPWSFTDRDACVNVTMATAKYLNCPNDSSAEIIDCLREKSVETLLTIKPASIGVSMLNFVVWRPTSEPKSKNAFITDTPMNLLAQNKMKDAPLITGVVGNEGLIVTAPMYANDTLYDEVKDNLPNLIVDLLKIYVPQSDPKTLSQKILQFYFGELTLNDKEATLNKFTDLVTDACFFYPQVVLLENVVETRKAPLFSYLFDYRGVFSETIRKIGSDKDIGVCHADDLIYLFNRSPESYGAPNLSMSPNDFEVVNEMLCLWETFVFTGTPIPNVTLWPPYGDSKLHLQIGNDSDPNIWLQNNSFEDRIRFWMKNAPINL